ncbi:helicase HerA domain-containing protein [Sandarakinorhabdus sp.]|uniref:ATP-binding protein n=1 Tax=Sandarakinorhabdus sp. TaxID=1916663 RepID=UPI00286E56B2|nr:DUF87 domain-containing protein [Sandarakinorhabdus sp.]
MLDFSAASARPAAFGGPVIGRVIGVFAGGFRLRLDPEAIAPLKHSGDPVLATTGMLGSLVKLESSNLWVIGCLRGVEAGPEGPEALVDFLGETDILDDGGVSHFRRGVGTFPRSGDGAHALTSAETTEVYSTDGRARIEVGVIYPTGSVRGAIYFDTFLSKNFAIVGSTGTGKSTATALILHRIIEQAPQGHVVVIDPHGEYSAAFSEQGVVWNVDNLELPYWLMNFEEHCEVLLTSEGSNRDMDRDILARCLLNARAKSMYAEGLISVTADTPIPYLMSALMDALVAESGKISESANATNFLRIRSKLEQLLRDPRHQFMFDRRYSTDTMADFMSRILRLPADGRPISIIDLSGVPSAVVNAVVSVLARIVLDYAVWSRGETKRPIVLVCEEAHRYIPSRSIAKFSPVRDVLERIAKEGRKYGVSLGLVTQRPSDLAEGALSQCGTFVSLRLNNERDQQFVRNAFPEGGKSMLDALPALRNRECIISGEGVAAPIRVRLDDLDPSKRPASSDPVYSELWATTGGEGENLARIIGRWRAQIR